MAKAFVEAVDLVVEKGGDGLDPFTKPVQNLYRALTDGPGNNNDSCIGGCSPAHTGPSSAHETIHERTLGTKNGPPTQV